VEQFTHDTEGIRRKRATYGPLSLTAGDHKVIGSTPDGILLAHPGRSYAELMSDRAIELWLAEQIEGLRMFEKATDDFSVHYYPQIKQSVRGSLAYLRELGRLPKRFDSFTI